MSAIIPSNQYLILFDGVCNLCNNSVTFIIKRDKHNQFLFAPLQGTTAEALLNKHKIDTTKIDSIILYHPESGLYFKSSAALKIASKLGWPLKMMLVFFVIPPFIRNWIYDVIAKNRYKWFGKEDQCMIPTKELQEKFMP